MNVKLAFLNDTLEEEVCVKQPASYVGRGVYSKNSFMGVYIVKRIKRVQHT